MKFEKSTRLISKGYFSKDLYWHNGVYHTYSGNLKSDDHTLIARIYKHPTDNTFIVALTDSACLTLDGIADIFTHIETQTGKEGTWQVWESNRGRWQS